MNELFNSLNVDFTYLPVINFAMQQNRVSLIRQLLIENKTDEPLKDITVTLSVEPEFAVTASCSIDAISAGESMRVDALKLNLSANYFAQLTERMSGSFVIEVFSEGNTIFKQTYPIDILAYDQWGGLSVLPEMLSAFITPNHPMLVPIIKRASAILEKWTGNSALDEYQSRNPDRVRKQMAAVYAAIAEQEIIYSTVPASFEEYGQRVRLVDVVLSQKLGNCLDLSLLYASCLEAIGIHSLVVIINGHAFVGAWLIADTFPDSVIDDVSFLTKRTADGINEITLVEATAMNQGNAIDFDKAVKMANAKLLKQDDFILALDVKRSRYSGIRPLPQRVLNGQRWEIKEDETPRVDKSEMTPEAVNPYDLSGISNEIVVTKQLLWERKLLDLSLRNNLLNIRVTKNTLQLIPADLDRLEDALSEGDEFRIMPKPTDWDNPLYDFGLYQSVAGSDPIIDLVKSEMSQKRLRSYLSENELGKALTHLYRSSRLSMEENGANTLYVALGLLRWYETPNSERPRYAPLLLLPVEIIRKSATKGYVIRSREEEAMMNITLLEMLRQNFGISISGLDPLPTDDSGVNVKLIYSIIRNGIKNQRKWDVEEQAILGIFSFSKFIMWNDIHNNAHKLIENKLVSSLMNGKIEWEVVDDMVDASVLDKELLPEDIVLPISADSSQLEAIYEAVNEKSFILHGPPGTGKSQTITNIIANALYRGKRVLFVAEKMAALSVVQNRLAAIGLAPFCLELHSNKAKKTTILSQLKETTEVLKTQSPEEFSQEASRLFNLKVELNAYIESLHKKYSFGSSLYDAITHYLSIDTNDIEFSVPQDLVSDLQKETLVEWEDLIDNLVSTGKACGHPYNHPLTGLKVTSYSAQIKDNAIRIINETIDILAKIKGRLSVFASLLGEENSQYDKKQIDVLSGIVSKILNIPELTPSLLSQQGLNEVLEETRALLPYGVERDGAKEKVLELYSEDVLNVNAKQLLTDWNASSNKWFLLKYFGQKKIKKQLQPYTISQSVDADSVKFSLTQISIYQDKNKHLNQHVDSFPSLFGKYGKKGTENWSAIEQIIDDTSVLNSLILNYAKDISNASRIKQHLSSHLSEGVNTFKSIHGNSLQEVTSLLECLEIINKQLVSQLGVNLETLYAESSAWIDIATKKLNVWLSNIDSLKDWYQWLSVADKLEQNNLGFVAAEYRDRNLDTEQLPAIFTKSLNRAYIDYIIAVEPQLELFKGKLFDDVIQKYKDLSLNFEEITKKELYARLASNIPSFTREAANNSEVGILQKNLKNNARGTTIRKLFDQIPTLLSRMCPCMLMSPISVAQYIDPDAEKFDLIIFDEASQMPTYEAIGAIARGANVVIVGDPKQMPPTSFFSTNTVDEDNIELEDLESILDDCLALSIPSKYLLWHYRSKHESLIAFSNSEYYDNKLLTFPSPDNIESKVKFVPIDGHYDKGKSRQNKFEAQAVVDEVARRLKDEQLRKRSIGVVTFSQVQQSLIEDLLSDMFVFNPELESLALDCEEPIFIKNLENVQGDERDVILFSVGYGPDASGKVSMNFGPLNRVGGERRLNVAVSRARYEMIIYSTLRSDQIDLNRTSSVGVAGLKRFLEYAERGEQVVVDKKLISNQSNANIEHIIADRLRSHGYDIHTNIGCSGYKVDIGVVDKKNKSNYLLGIICDGENYKRTKTTRDREIVQNNVLRLLGWNIIRVWTLDWWENPEEVVQTILRAIKDAENKTSISIPVSDLPKGEVKPMVLNSSASNPAPVLQKAVVIKEDVDNCVRKYTPVSLQSIKFPSEAFYMSEHRDLILNQIKQTIDKESPISKSLLNKRVIKSWGISRIGTKMDTYFEDLYKQLDYHQSQSEGITFFWQDEQQKIDYTIYRPDSGRDAVDLPPEEVANAMKKILTEEISLPNSDLFKLTAHIFGFARSGSNVDAAMNRGLDAAISRGFVKQDNGRVVIL